MMKLIDGYENDLGIFLRYTETKGDQVVMDVRRYSPSDKEFPWALEQLRNLED